MIPKISVFIIFVGLIAFFQIRRILKTYGIKEVLVYIIFMSMAALVGSLLIAGVDVPAQSVITRAFEPIGKAVLGK